MKIGILTFHWAPNYGAILQSYALQEYLRTQGHTVEIINYKPKQYDFGIKRFINSPGLLLSLKRLFYEEIRNRKLNTFRLKYLNLTQRYTSEKQIRDIAGEYDILISGSDQVLNPGFTLNGEDCPTSTYYLNFPVENTKRVGYALSFGCIDYPVEAKKYASKWINNFDYVSVRESSGEQIIKDFGFKSKCYLVPDPTVLYGNRLFDTINRKKIKGDYIVKYLLHGKQISLNSKLPVKTINHLATMDKWISMIESSKGVVTNSYHGMIVACLSHTPFVVLLQTKSLSGMNDRFYTFLKKIGLEDRIADEATDNVIEKLNTGINWGKVESCIDVYRKDGINFLKQI